MQSIIQLIDFELGGIYNYTTKLPSRIPPKIQHLKEREKKNTKRSYKLVLNN